MTNPITALFGDRDAKKAWDAKQARADALPRDFRASYNVLKSFLWKFTANNGKDIVAFADAYLPGPRPAYESSWRDELNRDAAKNRD